MIISETREWCFLDMASISSFHRSLDWAPVNHGTGVIFDVGDPTTGMLTLELESFLIEIDEGSIKNVGATDKSASVKLFGVETAEAREFGDRRVKLVFEDDDGNEVQVALFPDDVRKIARDIEALEDDSPVFE